MSCNIGISGCTSPLSTECLAQNNGVGMLIMLICRPQFLLHLDVLEDDYLLVVERPPLDILERLPPVLIEKKFGT